MCLARLLPACALLLCGSARATVIEPLGLDELVDHAEAIVVARVESQRARWVGDRTAIVTDVTLRVEQGLKGAADGQRIVVAREGGEVDGLGMRVVGAPSFRTGEEVLVFLETRGKLRWTVGMALGKLRIDRAGGQAIVRQDTAGLAFTRPPGGTPSGLRLDEVIARIVRRVAEGRRP